MDKSLATLCEAIKKIASQLKIQANPLSFTLLTGKLHQGKSSILKQSHLKQYPLDSLSSLNLFYNNQGIILEIGEAWLNESVHLLSNTLKLLNRCHENLKISGIILCVDSRELLSIESEQLVEYCRSHANLLIRFGKALGYQVSLAFLFTKLDTLMGFCEFFQTEHDSELSKPLGFTFSFYEERNKLLINYRAQFHHMIESLGQQVIKKLHPTRSGARRTLIREFPLQLASFQIPIQAFIQNIPLSFFKLHAIYFASAEQGGLSVDKLNGKIQNAYALTIQDKVLQAANYRAYFVEGALQNFLENSLILSRKLSFKQKIAIVSMSFSVAFILVGIIFHDIRLSRVLDEASKDLLRYENQVALNKSSAYYHLSQAENRISKLKSSGLLGAPLLKQLKKQIHKTTDQQLNAFVLPEMLKTLEAVITNSNQDYLAQYRALKIYLMFADIKHYSSKEVLAWFEENWQNSEDFPKDKAFILLKRILSQNLTAIKLNQTLIRDARNYLNALPAAYLYYSLTKASFPKEVITLNINGFELSTKTIPVYYTKEGYQELSGKLAAISHDLQNENWVLERSDLARLDKQLEEAYSFDYVNWWQNFIHHAHPEHYQNFSEARVKLSELYKANSLSKLFLFIQKQTQPENSAKASVFNQKIASQFTQLNLTSTTAISELNLNTKELEKYLTTISLIKDNGQTIFNLTKARFQNDNGTDPLSTIYTKTKSLPEPLAAWAKQIADDTWSIFIAETRSYLNKIWRSKVYHSYHKTIANLYPLDSLQKEEVSLENFDLFFSPAGTLNNFVAFYLKPFLDTSNPQWKPKEANGYLLPISDNLINELIRANIISNMFFADDSKHSKILFSLQKINLDPMVNNFQLRLGKTLLTDSQSSDSYTFFSWPAENAKLHLHSIDGQNFDLEENGVWAFFKILQKVNILVDNSDSSSLQILFEINGNSGRYLLKTQNPINPFSPGILTGFNLTPNIA